MANVISRRRPLNGQGDDLLPAKYHQAQNPPLFPLRETECADVGIRSICCCWGIRRTNLFVGLPLLRRQSPELLRVTQDEVQMPIEGHEPVSHPHGGVVNIVDITRMEPDHPHLPTICLLSTSVTRIPMNRKMRRWSGAGILR